MNQKQLVKEVKKKNIISNILILFKVIFELVPQFLVIHMVSKVFTNSLTLEIIVKDCSLIFLSFLLKSICVYISTWKAHDGAYGVLTEIRIQLIKHLKKLSLGFFQERKIGDLTNIIQHDVEQVEVYLAHGLPEIMSATFLPIVIFIVMLFIDWRLALIMISTIPLMWLTRKLAAPLWKKNLKIFSESIKKMQSSLMEYIQTIPVIKSFGKEETKTEETIQIAKDYIYWVKKAMAGVSVPMGLIIFFMEAGVILVVILGAYLLTKGDIGVSKFILAMILGGAFSLSITKSATFQHYNIMFNQAMTGIGSVLSREVKEKENYGEEIREGDIVIDKLSFSYPDKTELFKDINLTFKLGSKNALVGTSGCGKSTLANLIMGFWEPKEGSIYINGLNISEILQSQLNGLTSIVQQDVFLFNMSLEENIRIGKPDATLEEIKEAAKKARIHDFIMSFQKGYEQSVGESGVKLSGGEKQRISIARMILKNAPIIILDEATSAVDAENEAHIEEAIKELSKGKTVIVIAHHLNTITDADQITVMDEGSVVMTGTHNELMENSSLYKKMVYEQAKVDRWNIKGV